ncbi:MAG: hypothetical protein ACKOSS_00895 [Planctomycetia bacterium]
MAASPDPSQALHPKAGLPPLAAPQGLPGVQGTQGLAGHVRAVLSEDVPLTGREPLLGRLRLRLRTRPGMGWLGLCAPRGAGVSRLLCEMLAEARAAGSPAFAVAPAEAGHARGEPLRRGLAAGLRRTPPAALVEALAPVVPLGQASARALVDWLAAGPLAAAALLPPRSVLVAAVEALARGGLVCADDWAQLDELTRDVLAAAAAAQQVSVLAGRVEAAPGDTLPGPVWALEPLGESQLELLLRRWLHAAVAARRLAPDLLKASEGWPGRAVALVHALAAQGVLVPDGKGLRLAQWPAPWPALPDPSDALLQRLREEAAGGWRVVETATLLSEPVEADLLSDASGVKRSVVDALLGTLCTARSGHAPGCVLGDPALRALLRARMPATRRGPLVERMARACGRRAGTSLRGAGEALGRLEALVEGGSASDLAWVIPAALGALPARAVQAPAVAELLARATRRLVDLDARPPASLLLGVAQRLAEAGHGTTALGLLAHAALPAGGSQAVDAHAVDAHGADALAVDGHAVDGHAVEALLLRAQHAEPGPAAEAARTLEARLAAGGLEAGLLHRAWRALAARGGAPEREQRLALRAALASLPPGDGGAEAALRLALADRALARGRTRAALAHRRRAALLLEARGALAEAQPLWLHVGEAQQRLGREAAACTSFEAAVRAAALLGEREAEARGRLALAQLLLGRARPDEAVRQLEPALARVQGLPGEAARELCARLHVSLAHAHAGRGDAVREREHAARAHGLGVAGDTGLLAEAAHLVASLRAGVRSAAPALESCVQRLRAAGLAQLAASAAHALLDARLRAGDVEGAERLASHDLHPRARLAQARAVCIRGHRELGMRLLEALGRDAGVPTDLRAEAFARLAELQAQQAAHADARATAHSAEALLAQPHRNRAEDARTHRALARTFREVGEPARQALHSAAARVALRVPPPSARGGGERKSLLRARLERDPQPPAPGRGPQPAVERRKA